MNRTNRQFPSTEKSPRILTNRPLLIGMALVAVLTIALSILAAGKEPLAGDIAVLEHIQRIDLPGVGSAVNLFNWTGYLLPFMVTSVVIATMFYAFRLRSAAALIIIAAILSQTANAGLKLFFSSPRPAGDLVRTSEQASGYGFPSGHAMTTFVFVGTLVYLLHLDCNSIGLRVVAMIAGTLIVLGMGFSRIYIGAHWPSDVLGAYLWGGLFLLGLVTMYHWLTGKRLSGR